MATMLVVAAAYMLRGFYLSRTRSAFISEETQRGLRRIDEKPTVESNSQMRVVE